MIKEERQIVYRTFSVIALIALMIILFSCNKSTEAESCNCYETHELLEPTVINGSIQTVWNFQYNTPSTEQPCSNASDWIFISQSERYKVICQ
jgi:hypothetical protein